MAPLAPGLFSMTIGWPSSFCIWSAMTRAVKSAVPPGAKATIMWTGRAGKSSAPAALAKAVARSMAATQRAAAAELVLQPLEAAIEVIDAVDDGFAFGGERGDDQRDRRAQVGRHHRRA